MLNKVINNVAAKAVRNKTTLIGILLVIVLLNVFVSWHVLTEKTIYYWDLSGYWTYAIGLSNTFQEGTRAGIDLLLRSFASDYNYLPVLPSALLMQVFGNSRLVFILTILNLYVIPFAVIVAYLSRKYLFREMGQIYLPIAVAVVSFLPMTLIPLLGNMPDIVGLLIISLILLLFANMNFISRFSVWSIALGVLVCLLIVSRRWYTFWIVGAVVGLVLVTCYMLWIRNNKKVNKDFFVALRWPVVNMVVAGITALALLATLFPFTFQSFMVSYGDVYSAYRSGGHIQHLIQTMQYFGGLTIVFSLVGYIFVFTKMTHRATRTIYVFFAISSIVTFLVFSNVQDFGAHHYYLLLPALTLGLLAVVVAILEGRRYLLSTLFTGWLAASFLYAFFIPINTNHMVLWKNILGTQKTPIVRNDVSILKTMEGDIRSQNPNATVYVLSSSVVFNDSTLRNVGLPDAIFTNVLISAHIDKRDGFPNAFFAADYVLVPKQPQFHTANGQGQQVIIVPAKNILAGSAKNLQVVKEYTLEGGLKVVLYKKTAPYSKEFIEKLSKTFTQLYPGDKKFMNITDTSLNSPHASEKEGPKNEK